MSMSNSSFLADVIGDISPDRDYVLDPSRNPAIVLSSAVPPLVDNTRLVKLKGARLAEILRAKDHANEAGSEVLVVGTGPSSMRSNEDWIQLSRERETAEYVARQRERHLAKKEAKRRQQLLLSGDEPEDVPKDEPTNEPKDGEEYDRNSETRK